MSDDKKLFEKTDAISGNTIYKKSNHIFKFYVFNFFFGEGCIQINFLIGLLFKERNLVIVMI